MELRAIKYQAESYLFQTYNGFAAPPRLDSVSSRTKTESIKNYYEPIFVGTPTIRKGKYFLTRELDGKYLMRLKDDGHLFSLHPLGIESIDEHRFFSSDIFPKIAQYAWWTFNKVFLKTLQIAVQDIPPYLLPEFIEMLAKHPAPYKALDPVDGIKLESEPIKFARVKKLHCFQNHKEYSGIALIDEGNRAAILKCLRKRQREINATMKNAVKPAKKSGNYRAFSALFVNEEWRKQFEFVLSMLKPKYDTNENGANLVEAMRAKGRVFPNSHFQLFFITNVFKNLNAFKDPDLDLRQICRKLYLDLRIDLHKSKFSVHSTEVVNINNHIGGKAIIKEELIAILKNAKIL